MSKQFNNKKCSRCNIEYNQDLGPSFPLEVGRQRRIFTKNGKDFCFNCLTSEYNVNCQLCHKRINSKDELGSWSGVISINGIYNADANHFGFSCLGCSKINTGIHRGYNDSKCRISGCFQKAYYECMDLCLSHSKPCKGGKIKSDGKKCSAAMGIDEGDFCEFCKKQIETKNFKRVHERAQNYWSSLSELEKGQELARVVEGIKQGKYWATIAGQNEGYSSGIAPNETWWQIKNGKMVSDKPHLVPIEIVEEFEKGVKFQEFQNDQLDANYFKKNEIEQLGITSSGELVVKNSAGQKVIVSDNNLVNNQDLQAVKNYLLESGKTSLNESQLNSFLLNRNNSSIPTSNPNNKLELILAIGGMLIIGLFSVLVMKRKTSKKLK